MFRIGDRIEREGKTFQVTRITPAGHGGTSFSDGPTFHATIVRDGKPVSGGYTINIWSRSHSNPTSAFSRVPQEVEVHHPSGKGTAAQFPDRGHR